MNNVEWYNRPHRLMVAGILGGNAAGTWLTKYDLGRIWNTITGAVGRAVGGEVLQTDS
jgi:hypothetical protein